MYPVPLKRLSDETSEHKFEGMEYSNNFSILLTMLVRSLLIILVITTSLKFLVLRRNLALIQFFVIKLKTK